jgi:hypothetical protein
VVCLIIGLVLFVNAASSHVTGNSTYNQGEVSPGETSCNVIIIGPVGSGNLTVGYHQIPGSHGTLPPEMNASVSVPVHLKVTDPANHTLLEQDTVTPGMFPIDFTTRGEYKVYLTNNGNERNAIPIGTTFEMDNPQNREADKYLLSVVLTAGGAVCIAIGLILNFISRRFGKSVISKSTENQTRGAKP